MEGWSPWWWHGGLPLGPRVARERPRATELQPGVVFKVAVWMLDPAACAAMEIGARRAPLAAFAVLHELSRRSRLAASSPQETAKVNSVNR